MFKKEKRAAALLCLAIATTMVVPAISVPIKVEAEKAEGETKVSLLKKNIPIYYKWEDTEAMVSIFSPKENAEYTFKPSEGLTYNRKKYYSEKEQYDVIQEIFSAEKPGTYSITVEETYQGETKEIGTVEIKVKPLKIKKKLTIKKGESFSFWDVIKYAPSNKYVFWNLSDKEYEEGYLEFENGTTTALKKGSCTLHIYIGDGEKLKNKKKVGTCKVIIK